MDLLWRSGRTLAFDMMATLLFVGLFGLTHNLLLAVATGAVVGAMQIGWELYRRRPVEALQWMSLALVVASGFGAYIAHDPRVVLIKPSVIYVIVGVVMLRAGWMNRYMPEEARTWMPDLIIRWGYVWAGLMFLSAALNLVIALNLSLLHWAAVMGIWATASKLTLFGLQFVSMRAIGQRRARLAEALMGSTEPALA